MITNNEGLHIIGVDMGYGNMKTANCHFPTGLTVYDTEPAFRGDVILWEDKYYKVGEGRKPFIADKTVDNDFYIMTLAAVAMECKANDVHDGNIYISVGIPVSWIREQRESLREYIMQNKKLKFTFNGEKYRLTVKGCHIMPQGYPALLDRFNELEGLNMIADIGNGTLNVMLTSTSKVDERKCFTEKLGVEQYKIAAKNAVMDRYGKQIDICVLEEFIRTGTAHIPGHYLEVLKQEAERYANTIMDTLYKYDYDEDFMNLYVIGGGHCLLKRYGKYVPQKVIFVEDICAAAKGFEKASFLKLEKGDNGEGSK
jgi:plasmid segregation protein ParM